MALLCTPQDWNLRPAGRWLGFSPRYLSATVYDMSFNSFIRSKPLRFALICRQSRTILNTAPGQRVMCPEFGCRIHELVFAPCNATTAGMAERYVREAWDGI